MKMKFDQKTKNAIIKKMIEKNCVSNVEEANELFASHVATFDRNDYIDFDTKYCAVICVNKKVYIFSYF
jgi:hypothetical protein